MTKRKITITEQELSTIVTETVKRVLDDMKLISEMAVARKDYFQHGISQSATVLKHIGKICVFENDVLNKHWVHHWETEIAAQVYDLGRIDITKDSKDKSKKRKAFQQSFIEGRLGQDFSEYDTNMPSYIIDALEEEGLSKEDMRKIDVNAVAAKNKERIKKYLYAFVPLMAINDLTELRDKIREVAFSF